MKNIKKVICIFVFLIADLLALLSSFLIAFALRKYILAPLLFPTLPLSVQLKYGYFYSAIIIVIIFTFEKLYVRRFSFWSEFRQMFRGITIALLILIVVIFLDRSYNRFSRIVIFLVWIISLLIFPIFRYIAKRLLFHMNIWKKNIVILGNGEYALRIKTEIERNVTLGYTVIGFIKVDVGFGLGRRREDRENDAPFNDKIRVLGSISNLPEISKKYHVYDIIIGMPEISMNRLKTVLNHLENIAETIRIIPSTGNVFAWGVEIDKIGDILALSIPQNLMKPWNIVVKFIMEIIIAILLTIVFFPIGIIIAIAIKIDSPGPIFSVQERIGKNGKIFKCYKFRSMYIDEKQRLKAYVDDHAEVRREWDEFQKIKGYDPRVTAVGKIIRKFSLDEFAQIINFFIRNMNIIGPRPYLPREMHLMLDKANIISRVKPGITGLWQVRGRNNLPFKERLILDEYYIRNWSIWLDFVIFMKTIKTFITREGAY